MEKAGAAPRLRDRIGAFVQLDQNATAGRPKAVGVGFESKNVGIKAE